MTRTRQLLADLIPGICRSDAFMTQESTHNYSEHYPLPQALTRSFHRINLKFAPARAHFMSNVFGHAYSSGALTW